MIRESQEVKIIILAKIENISIEKYIKLVKNLCEPNMIARS